MKKWTDIIEKLTISGRFFLWSRRIRHDSMEGLPFGSQPAGTDRKRKKKIKSIFQQTSLGKETGQYGQDKRKDPASSKKRDRTRYGVYRSGSSSDVVCVSDTASGVTQEGSV